MFLMHTYMYDSQHHMGPSINDVTHFWDFISLPPPCHPFYYVGLWSNVIFWQIPPHPKWVMSLMDGSYWNVCNMYMQKREVIHKYTHSVRTPQHSFLLVLLKVMGAMRWDALCPPFSFFFLLNWRRFQDVLYLILYNGHVIIWLAKKLLFSF